MKQRLLIALLVTALAVGVAAPVHAQTYGAAYVTAITYQNLSNGTATITFSFYNEANGTPMNANYTLGPKASGSLNVGSLGSIASGFKGSAVMTSDQPIAAVLVQLPPSTIVSKTRPLSNGLSVGSSTVFIATALKYTFSTNSIISVQNTDSVDNDFSVSFYAAGNTTPLLVDKTAKNIPPGAAKYYDLGVLYDLGTSFNGSDVVKATRSTGGSPGNAVPTVMELGTASNGSQSKYATAFEGAFSGATTVYMPSAMCNYGSLMNNSNFALLNTSAINLATVITTFSPGTVTNTIGVGQYSKASVNACAAGNKPGYLGAATITSTEPIIAIGKIGGGGLSTSFMGATSGASRIALPYVRWASDAAYNVSGGTQRTFITIQNVGDTKVGSGTVSAKYYDANGNLVETHNLGAIDPGAKVNSNANANHPTNTTFSFGFSPSGGSAIIEGPEGSQLSVVARVQSFLTYSTEFAGEDYNGIPVSP